MHAISPIIRLDDDHDLREVKLWNWKIDENARLVFHRPGKLIFLMTFDPRTEESWVRPSAISARVVHICRDRRMPGMKALRRIGKDAIHVFALMADICQEPFTPILRSDANAPPRYWDEIPPPVGERHE